MEKSVEAFAKTMQFKLDKNRYKPCPEMNPYDEGRTWERINPRWLLSRCREELDELEEAINMVDFKSAQLEAADVGNFAMMIHDQARKELEFTQPPVGRKIYVASSWRNKRQPEIVAMLRQLGHKVYDFKNPETGFHWRDIDPEWEKWTNEAYLQGLHHPLAVTGFKTDFDAMQWADTFVLVLPCGRSAHLELGWACGQSKETCILLGEDAVEPELMNKMVTHICPDLANLVGVIGDARD